MNFKSQICTTKEQSERLLALGLKKETADMKYPYGEEIYWGTITGYLSDLPEIINSVDDEATEDDLPAWSLNRLIELCATPKVPFIRVKFQNTYDEIISLIEETIKFGAFNKAYLN